MGSRAGEQVACGQTGANILVDRTGATNIGRSWSANAGHWVLPNRYPVATRVQRKTKTFGNRRVNARFLLAALDRLRRVGLRSEVVRRGLREQEAAIASVSLIAFDSLRIPTIV